MMTNEHKGTDLAKYYENMTKMILDGTETSLLVGGNVVIIVTDYQ